MRSHSFAFCGGAFGDEGKGRIVDELVRSECRSRDVIVYRDNGGANAGHTVELADGRRIAFHQLPSGVFHRRATVVLGKGMVLHPADLVSEIDSMTRVIGGKNRARILIDELAVLSLDTHRVFEGALKLWQEGGKGATGRGIAPAYADILLRHPVRMRDLVRFDQAALRAHYRLYRALLSGLGVTLRTARVPRLGEQQPVSVGGEDAFLGELQRLGRKLAPYVCDAVPFLRSGWLDEGRTFIFEKSQAIGLDYRWGVYPDVTASDTTFGGIFAASEGVIDPGDIGIRAAVLKATYMSSVGSRVLPTAMTGALADRIRQDAREYGATTGRPRGIAHLDMPALAYFCRVGRVNRIVLTHMDLVYPDVPVRVGVGYIRNGKPVAYRPDQEYLRSIKVNYQEMAPWDSEAVRRARTFRTMPSEARVFVRFLEKQLRQKVFMVTTGPKREQSIYMEH